MKIENTPTKVHTNVGAPAIALGIDMAGMNHVMSILSNLYSDPYLAVLREYSTNARDSHVATLNRRPIEITSPTDELPQLVITDRGLGLGCDELIDTYSRYGSSTKRDSNDQVGAFGIGSKSAFTISTQFTVTGVKNGRKTIVLFSISEDQTPILQILEETDTTQGNGVQVAVPVDDVDLMRRTIIKFFFSWPPGSVFVDGVVPPSLYADKTVLQVAPDKFLRKVDPNVPTYNRQSSLKIVMGSVAYDASSYGLPQMHVGATAYIEVPIGVVDIAPSRETLKDTERTREFVSQAIADFNRAMEQTENAAIAATGMDKVKAARSMTEWGEFKGLSDHYQWARQAKQWGLAPIEPEQHSQLPVKFSVHPQTLGRLLLVTGIDTERKVNLFYKREARWRGTYHQQENLLAIPAAVETGDIEWLKWGPGRPTKTVSYKVFKQEAMVLYRKAVTSSTSVRYETKIGQHPQVMSDLSQVLVDCKTRKVLVLKPYEGFLAFLDDRYIQIRLNHRQGWATAVNRLKSAKLENRDVLIAQERDRNTRNLTQEEKEVISVGKAVQDDPYIRVAVQLLKEAGTLVNPRIQEFVKKLRAFEDLPVDKQGLPVPEDMAKAAEDEAKWIHATFPLLPHVRWTSWQPDKKMLSAVRAYVNA